MKKYSRPMINQMHQERESIKLFTPALFSYRQTDRINRIIRYYLLLASFFVCLLFGSVTIVYGQTTSNINEPSLDHDNAIAGATSIPNNVTNVAPVVTITQPHNDDQHEQGDNISFTATARDAEDGDISYNIAWSSSINGHLGTGASINSATLSIGKHRIIANITDSDNNTKTTELMTTVVPEVVQQTSLFYDITSDAAEEPALSGAEQFNPEGQIQDSGWAAVYNPVTNMSDTLPYEVIDGMAIHDGDIILGPASDFQTPSVPPGSLIEYGVALKYLGSRWKNGIVYYDLNNHTGSTTILKAMKHIEQNTSIRFEPRTSQADYIKFQPSSGCSSYIGRTGRGAQNVNLNDPGCLYGIGTTAHELFHALGFFHEQSRSDRDNYVTINWNNIPSNRQGNFKIAGSGFDIGPYNYNSIMHYGAKAFAIDWNFPTIYTKPEGIKIGNRTALDQGDIDAMQYIYHTDLQLDLNTVSEVYSGAAMAAQITISNLGDSSIGDVIAKDVKVTMPLPAQSAYNSFFSSDSWNCQQSGQNVECSLAILDRNANTALIINFSAPTHLNSMQINPMVSASNRDIELSNNASTAQITIIGSKTPPVISSLYLLL